MNEWRNDEEMYEAMLRRSSEYDGLFVVAVRTTGIFCKPTCPARKPKRENVEFFPSAREALSAGYRACLRCKPLEPHRTSPSIVRELMNEVQANPAVRVRDGDLRDRGLDPSTVRRQFNTAIGMTFQAYQRAHRLGLAFAGLCDNKRSILHAADEAGYESLSGFTDAFKSLFGTPPSGAGEVACLIARYMDSPLGPLVAIAHDEGICLLEFCDRRALERELLDLRKRFKSVIVPGEHPHLGTLAKELEAYFAGERLTFEVPLHMQGSPFQKQVWEGLRRIPAGETRSYKQQAEMLGRPTAVRAVARANGENRIGIIIPCHRVIAESGDLCGYGGGLWRKRWLIEHEKGAMRTTAATHVAAAKAQT